MTNVDINKYASEITSSIHSIKTGFFDALFDEIKMDLAMQMLLTESAEEREALFQQALNVIALKSKLVTVITEYNQRMP